MVRGVAVVALGLVGAVALPSRADSEAPETAHVIAADDGVYFFKSVPAKWHWEGEHRVVEREAYGVAYRVKEDGGFEELWRVEGWYTREGFLSRDGGRYFVRIGPWAKDQQGHTDLALAFYDRGKLLKSYRANQLIRNQERIVNSVSHYNWRAFEQTEPNGFLHGWNSFHLVMADRTDYTFDATTGEIVERSVDPNARNFLEVISPEEPRERESDTLYKNSKLSQSFSPYFSLKGCQLDRQVEPGQLANRVWTGFFEPNKPLLHGTTVEVELPADQPLAVSVEPEKVLAALKQAFAHPFLEREFEERRATRIHLRMQADSLIRDARELREFVNEVKGSYPEEDELASWAFFVIECPDQPFRSFYLNTQTGKVIEECSDRTLVLYDAAGAVQTRKPFVRRNPARENGSATAAGH